MINYKLDNNNYKYFFNKIGDIGTKYLGLGLSKLIKLIYLELDLQIILKMKFEILELNI